MSRIVARLTLLVATIALSGCATHMKYASSGEPNITFEYSERMFVLDYLLFNSVTHYVDIYSLAGSCKLEYLGAVEVGRSEEEARLPVNKDMYLVFNFVQRRGRETRTGIEHTFIRVRPDAHYKVKAWHKYDIYRADVIEYRNGKERVLPMRPVSCT